MLRLILSVEEMMNIDRGKMGLIFVLMFMGHTVFILYQKRSVYKKDGD